MAVHTGSFRKKLRATVVNQLWGGALARYRQDAPRVVAIGGSLGKTSTKEAVALVLAESQCAVVKTAGNLATDTGVPLSLLGYEAPPAGAREWLGVLRRARQRPRVGARMGNMYYVLEYSSDAVGDTAFLTSRIPPQVAVLTTVVPVHMESYKTEAAMIEETLSLVDALPLNGIIIANADDPVQRRAFTKARVGKRLVLWYGVTTSAPRQIGVWAQEVSMGSKGLRFTISFVVNGRLDPLTQQSHRLAVQSTVLGQHQLYPLLAAAAVGWVEQLDAKQIKHALQAYEVPNGRGKLIPGKKGITIIDDTANAASPEAVKAGLAVLAAYAPERRHVAILGTMNELGEWAEAAHHEVAREAAHRATVLVAVGRYAELMATEAKRAGMPSLNVMAFATAEQLLDHLDQVVHARDVVYVKASQSAMFLERVVKRLMAHPDQAAALLVRQSAFWERYHLRN